MLRRDARTHTQTERERESESARWHSPSSTLHHTHGCLASATMTSPAFACTSERSAILGLFRNATAPPSSTLYRTPIPRRADRYAAVTQGAQNDCRNDWGKSAVTLQSFVWWVARGLFVEPFPACFHCESSGRIIRNFSTVTRQLSQNAIPECATVPAFRTPRLL
jgi:hypothetical protein